MGRINFESVNWEYCPISRDKIHTVYRGWHVHSWNGFICFYPAEGEASYKEMKELAHRIPKEYTKYITKPPYHLPQLIPQFVWSHPCENNEGVCSLKKRLDGRVENFCIEIWAGNTSSKPVTIDNHFKILDEITDALYEQSGLKKFDGFNGIDIKEGRVR